MRLNTIRLAVMGGNGAFAYALLSQLVFLPDFELVAICDLDAQKTITALSELGYSKPFKVISDESRDIDCSDAIKIVKDYRFLLPLDFDILVEATGNPEIGAAVAEACLKVGKHVCMVTKETESVAGPYLWDFAVKQHLRYALARGDQPANLLTMYEWASGLGLEIVAIGKSSEYDFIYDPPTGTVKCSGDSVYAPELSSYWSYRGLETITQRKALLSKLCKPAPPDYCELTIVSNYTGFIADTPTLHYPICRINELADVFVSKLDGGLLEGEQRLDVFYHVRTIDEASFAGGVFLIVKCKNSHVWSLLREKGHVVSKNGSHACLYFPFHLLGVETAHTLREIAQRALPKTTCKPVSTCVVKVLRDFIPGEVLRMDGHHHIIADTEIEMHSLNSKEKVLAPYYLAAGKTVVRPITKGHYIHLNDLALSDSSLKNMI